MTDPVKAKSRRQILAGISKLPAGFTTRIFREQLVTIPLTPGDFRFLGRFRAIAFCTPRRAARLATNLAFLARFIAQSLDELAAESADADTTGKEARRVD